MIVVPYDSYFLTKDASGGFVGGKYATKEAAELAITDLDSRLLEELWSKKVAANDQEKMLISIADIEAYKKEAYVYSEI